MGTRQKGAALASIKRQRTVGSGDYDDFRSKHELHSFVVVCCLVLCSQLAISFQFTPRVAVRMEFAPAHSARLFQKGD